MKYVVANSRGEILNGDASRASEAINWARNNLPGQTSVRKVPEIFKIVGEDPDDVLLVADVETAQQQGWETAGA